MSLVEICRDKFRNDGPRWVVVVIDILLVWVSFMISYVLIFKQRGYLEIHVLFGKSIVVTFVYLLVFYIFKPYQSIIRRTGLRDLLIVGKTVGASFIILFIGSHIFELLQAGEETNYLPVSYVHFSQTQLLLHALLTIILMGGARLTYKAMYHSLFWSNKENSIRVILFGAGNMGHLAYQMLEMGSKNRYRVVAVVDDNPNRIGKKLQGQPIRPLEVLSVEFIEKLGGAQELVIAVDNAQPERLQRISEVVEKLPIKIKIIPTSTKMLDGAVATQQIRPLKVGDLLGRKAIDINNPVVFEALKGKVILVTGGAGSIGSELVRQIVLTGCAHLLVLDQAESALYDVQQELKQKMQLDKISFLVGDVRDDRFMDNIISGYRPHIIFHAAAYKHVPLMEDNPYEAILTNVHGSSLVARLADKYGVEKFIMVSTDKAVNPTNVMGATKRIAEIYVSALNTTSKTAYIVTRFGNVLGSNGSVIPLFEQQIKAGGPLTVTHPDITRYFMTIPEACQLVQEAGVMGNGGEVFVFDMGKPVKIMELAKQMIRLKGLSYPEDVDIRIVGLRPGEKIFEELLANGENTMKTYHEKIMIAKVNTNNLDQKHKKIDELCKLVQTIEPWQAKMRLVELMKEIVPEFLSQNSVFASLDQVNMKNGHADLSIRRKGEEN